MENNQHNDKGQKHGYWEQYYHNGNHVMCKGNYNNGEQHGYWEDYWHNGKLFYKGYFNNGKRTGYLEFYDYDGDLITQIFYT